MPKSHEMTSDEILLLKFFSSTEDVSVEYYSGGKCYTLPASAIVLDWPYIESQETLNIHIDCSYTMQMGVTYLHCCITRDDLDDPMEDTLIPMDPKRRNKHQKELMSLIDTCSRRLIVQEMMHQKYAITSAVQTLNGNKEYS